MGMRVAERAGTQHNTLERAELLRPILERAALEARQLELDPDTVLSLFTHILKEQA
jgi:GntR family transcriptional regulator